MEFTTASISYNATNFWACPQGLSCHTFSMTYLTRTLSTTQTTIGIGPKLAQHRNGRPDFWSTLDLMIYCTHRYEAVGPSMLGDKMLPRRKPVAQFLCEYCITSLSPTDPKELYLVKVSQMNMNKHALMACIALYCLLLGYYLVCFNNTIMHT